MLEINKQTARRYVLGRQGVWPARRWEGAAGVHEALRNCEAVQVDPISVIARNHHLVLWSRVADYQPAWLEQLLYVERRFFEHGGIMFIFPLEQMPYWQPLLQRRTGWRERAERDMPHIITEVRERIAREGPLSSRDFKDRHRVSGGFNTIKDTSYVLDFLWDTGQLMIHSRRGLDKVYELTERLVETNHPPVTLEEAKDFFVEKSLRDTGLASAAELSRRVSTIVRIPAGSPDLKERLQKLLDSGVAAEARIEDRKETLYFPAEDQGLLEALNRGQIPANWARTGNTIEQEVNFLAPLDNIIWDRNRLKSVFDFDYVWEVYKPAPLRRWGYYTMPVLYGDRLVARIDPKLERKTGRLIIQGFWLDEPALAEDKAFAQALATGLGRFARFHQAKSLDLATINYPILKAQLVAALEK